MTAHEPLSFDRSLQAVADVTAKLAAWEKALAARRSDHVTDFESRLVAMQPPDGASFDDYAEAQVDGAIKRWCQQRDAFSSEIVRALDPDTVIVTQVLGKAPELGQLIGLHLDNAVRALDADLRDKADYEKARRIAGDY